MRIHKVSFAIWFRIWDNVSTNIDTTYTWQQKTSTEPWLWHSQSFHEKTKWVSSRQDYTLALPLFHYTCWHCWEKHIWMTVWLCRLKFLCTHNSASLGLFPSAPARVYSNIDIDIDIQSILYQNLLKWLLFLLIVQHVYVYTIDCGWVFHGVPALSSVRHFSRVTKHKQANK